jgi:hypothetical protein
MPVEALLELQAKRRTINRALVGVIAAGGLVDLDQVATDIFWHDNQTRVLPLDECADMCSNPHWYEEEVWLGCPGMGHKSGMPVARAMANALKAIKESRLSMYVSLSDKGPDEQTYPDILQWLSDRCDRISTGGQSLGGIVDVEGARVLREASGGRTDIRFGRKVMIGTPFRMNNVREEYIAKVLADVGRFYPGGILGSMIAGVANAVKINRRGFLGDIPRGIWNAGRTVLTGDSPHIALRGLVLLDNIDMTRNWREVSRAFDSDTRMMFVGSDEDEVVDCGQALEDWGNFAADVDSPFEHIWLEHTGHANVEAASDHLHGWMRGV